MFTHTHPHTHTCIYTQKNTHALFEYFILNNSNSEFGVNKFMLQYRLYEWFCNNQTNQFSLSFEQKYKVIMQFWICDFDIVAKEPWRTRCWRCSRTKREVKKCAARGEAVNCSMSEAKEETQKSKPVLMRSKESLAVKAELSWFFRIASMNRARVG